MSTESALAFAQTARLLGAQARQMGLSVPAFRSPPRTGEERTIRHYDGGSVVSVRLRDRPREDWQRDMVDGVLAANALNPDGPEREQLLEAVKS